MRDMTWLRAWDDHTPRRWPLYTTECAFAITVTVPWESRRA